MVICVDGSAVSYTSCFNTLIVYIILFFFFNDTATPEIYTYRHTLSLHDALPISAIAEPFAERGAGQQGHDDGELIGGDDPHRFRRGDLQRLRDRRQGDIGDGGVEHHQHQGAEHATDRGRAPGLRQRSEEHTSELQSLMRISYAVFCLKKNT